MSTSFSSLTRRCVLVVACVLSAPVRQTHAESELEPFTFSPESHALVVADVEFRVRNPLGMKPKGSVESGVLYRENGGLAPSLGGPIKGLLVFHPEPGSYRVGVVGVTMRTGQMTENLVVDLPEDSTRALSVTVAAGEVRYLGQLQVLEKRSVTSKWDRAFDLDRDPKHEAEAWKAIAKKAAGTPWEPLVKARLAGGTGAPARPATSDSLSSATPADSL